MGSEDVRDVVRRGYDALSYDYRSDDAEVGGYAPWLAATFLRADATRINLPPGSFDAVVCLYALIHMPLADQPDLISRIATWLRPGGWLLATAGHDAWTGTEDNWLGGPAPMWWSHADAATYRSWLQQARLTIISEDFVAAGTSGHTLFWAQRPPFDASPL